MEKRKSAFLAALLEKQMLQKPDRLNNNNIHCSKKVYFIFLLLFSVLFACLIIFFLFFFLGGFPIRSSVTMMDSIVD